jgi:NAD(P)-dependent dehydrogenase (short-subunit alcohol dehydrogenase family)
MTLDYNPFSLQDKKVLVTGATSGIGKAIAIECSKMGAKLYITGRDEKRLMDTLQNLSGEGHKSILADLLVDKDLDFIVENIEELNGVVFSAGILKNIPLKLIKEKSLNEVMQVNLNSPVFLTQKLHKKKILLEMSSLVYISSIASSYASLGNILYMASKGALNSFTKGIALELASSRIRANSIQPGMIKTNLNKIIPTRDFDKYVKRYPLGRLGEPEEVAYSAIYLLSDASQWITGSILTIDGGITLR